MRAAYGITTGYYGNTVNIAYGSLSTLYGGALSAAVNALNTKTSYNVTMSSTGSNAITAVSFGTGYSNTTGSYTLLSSNGNSWRKATQFLIKINTDIVNSSKSTNYRTSVIAHEICHALSLCDLTSSIYASTSIMCYYRNRDTLYLPTSNDYSHIASIK